MLDVASWRDFEQEYGISRLWTLVGPDSPRLHCRAGQRRQAANAKKHASSLPSAFPVGPVVLAIGSHADLQKTLSQA